MGVGEQREEGEDVNVGGSGGAEGRGILWWEVVRKKREEGGGCKCGWE